MSSDLYNSFHGLFSFWWENDLGKVFADASKGFAALFNTVLEFTGQQAVPNVLGGK
ncbi:hypothetical protein [Corynebacterium kozikiae]|uniref:hypothetical protein n=1 Tax=Corynebacterium kozikiae TaxID=2968469 RepID=UPI00211BDFF6|nr:hypothetical protein [Corynebacterium sp. 76QC2CO]MCQ9343705.1 hypothetical protein [Corynebacterium sp. 76QC2CO]